MRCEQVEPQDWFPRAEVEKLADDLGDALNKITALELEIDQLKRRR